MKRRCRSNSVALVSSHVILPLTCHTCHTIIGMSHTDVRHGVELVSEIYHCWFWLYPSGNWLMPGSFKPSIKWKPSGTLQLVYFRQLCRGFSTWPFIQVDIVHAWPGFTSSLSFHYFIISASSAIKCLWFLEWYINNHDISLFVSVEDWRTILSLHSTLLRGSP